jgi:hypothetical protein
MQSGIPIRPLTKNNKLDVDGFIDENLSTIPSLRDSSARQSEESGFGPGRTIPAVESRANPAGRPELRLPLAAQEILVMLRKVHEIRHCAEDLFIAEQPTYALLLPVMGALR